MPRCLIRCVLIQGGGGGVIVWGWYSQTVDADFFFLGGVMVWGSGCLTQRFVLIFFFFGGGGVIVWGSWCLMVCADVLLFGGGGGHGLGVEVSHALTVCADLGWEGGMVWGSGCLSHGLCGFFFFFWGGGVTVLDWGLFNCHSAHWQHLLQLSWEREVCW